MNTVEKAKVEDGKPVLSVKVNMAEVAAVAKYPQAVALLVSFKREYGAVTDNYRKLVAALRVMKIGPKELTLLLMHTGYNKYEASKMKLIVEAPDALFQKYLDGAGFKPTVEAIRAEKGGSHGIASLPAKVVALFKIASESAVQLPEFRQGKTVVHLAGFTVTVGVKKVKPAKKSAGEGKGSGKGAKAPNAKQNTVPEASGAAS